LPHPNIGVLVFCNGLTFLCNRQRKQSNKSKQLRMIPSGTKITITGDLGSGKSAVSHLLCERTGFEYISTGRIQRGIAAEMGIFIALGKDPNGYVIDSRMAWFFLPDSFKVYLQTDVTVSARRILNDPKRNSEQYKNVEEAVEKILARKQSENTRFLLKYGADCAALSNFDLVIDTTKRDLEAVADLILTAVARKEQGEV
jgi:CMP/dCMP kinase